MPEPPFYRVEKQVLSLTATHTFAFSADTSKDVCIMLRSAERWSKVSDGKYELGAFTPDVGPITLGETRPNGSFQQIRRRGWYEVIYTPYVLKSETVEYTENIVNPEGHEGDARAYHRRYTFAPVEATGPIAKKKTLRDLPRRPEGQGYDHQIQPDLAMIALKTTIASNDFANPTWPPALVDFSPILVRLQGEVSTEEGSHVVWPALCEGSTSRWTVPYDGSDGVRSLRFGNSTNPPQYKMTDKVLINPPFGNPSDPFDGDKFPTDGVGTYLPVRAPNLANPAGGGALETLETGRYRIRHTGEGGEARVGKPPGDPRLIPAGLPRVEVWAKVGDPDHPRIAAYETRWINQYGEIGGWSPESPGIPQAVNQIVKVNEEKPGGPPPAVSVGTMEYGSAGSWIIGNITYPLNWHPVTLGFTKSIHLATEAHLWQFFHVAFGDDWDPGGNPVDYGKAGRYPLSMDWTGMLLTRIAYQTPGETGLKLRSSNDGEASWSTLDLTEAGSAPSILCLEDGRMLLATSGVSLRQTADDGTEWTPMISPGSGYYPCIYEARSDGFSPLFVVAHTSDTNAGAINLYRSWDGGATWDAAIAVKVDGAELSIPAQRVSLTGSMSEILLAYYDAGVKVLKSTDAGATWATT